MTCDDHFNRCLRALRGLLALGLLILASACGGGSEDTDATTGDVHGWAHVGGPLVGAQVRILSTDGRELGRARQPTYDTGTWHVRLSRLPAAFTVEVSGGLDGGQPFKGTLLHTERAYDGFAPLDVNPATTLAARFQALHPDLPAADVEGAVRRFLSIPARVSLDRHLRASDLFFSGTAFVAAMPPGRGFDEHLLSLAQQLNVAEPRSFKGASPARDPVHGRARALAADTGLSGPEAAQDGAQVLLAAATGGPDGAEAAVGNILISKIFGGQSADQAILKMLVDIGRKLDRMSQDLDAILKAIDNLTVKVDKARYALQVQPLMPLVNDIDQAWDTYTQLIQTRPEDAGQLASARKKLLKFLNEVPSDSSCARSCRMKQAFDDGTLQQTLVGTALVPGALELWNEQVLSQRKGGPTRFVDADTQHNAQAAFRYWRTEQVKLYVLLTEFGHVVQHSHPHFLNRAWATQYGSSAGKRWAEQSDAADHVDQLTFLQPGFLYDRLSGVVWPGDLDRFYPPSQANVTVLGVALGRPAGLIDDGNDLGVFQAGAFAKLAKLSNLSGWTYPHGALLQSLISTDGPFSGPVSADGDRRNLSFLTRSGFGAWLGTGSWDGYTYAEAFADAELKGLRRIVNLVTGEEHNTCDGMPPDACVQAALRHGISHSTDPWRLTPGGFLPVRYVAAGERFMPDGW